MKQTFLIATMAVLLTATCSGRVWADPVRLDGTITAIPRAVGVSTFVDLLVRGDSFAITRSISLVDSEARGLPCQRSGGCVSGDTARATVELHPFGAASGVVSGTAYSDMLVAADLYFVAAAVVLPDVVAGTTFTASFPFTFSGHILGYASPATPLVRILDTYIEGSGLGELSLQVTPRGSTLAFTSPVVRYTFEPVAVPEPSALTLIGSALGVGTWVRRKRRA